ncbi:MAG: PmeII family type II restriction endonuclease [Anaerolineales bacterium]|jgi:hypothetical protein|nr:PmeII family type II restriction endonuclease [Anaerolineales bacterium]
MNPLNLNDVSGFIQENIGEFYSRREAALHTLKLGRILQKKNPYLFKAKNIHTAQDLVKGLLDAHLSSQEEAIFGEFLEKLAIFVCKKVYAGKKSSAEGIDLEFDLDGIIYIISVKSGPNWGNSGQVKRMIDDFQKAKRILRTGNPQTHIVAVNGCCYGKDNQPEKKQGYYKYCGQEFWALISGNEQLYLEIIKPLGHDAHQKNEAFTEKYLQILSDFVVEFQNDFCDGILINWEKLVQFNSGKTIKKEKEKK